jgi:hypothetical protein
MCARAQGDVTPWASKLVVSCVFHRTIVISEMFPFVVRMLASPYIVLIKRMGWLVRSLALRVCSLRRVLLFHVLTSVALDSRTLDLMFTNVSDCRIFLFVNETVALVTLYSGRSKEVSVKWCG